MAEKTRVIRFRINEQMYSYINELVIEMKKLDSRWTISEFLRMIISYFLMAHMLGELKKPFYEVKREFTEWANSYYPPKGKKKSVKKRAK
jgi:hypothetical protein